MADAHDARMVSLNISCIPDPCAMSQFRKSYTDNIGFCRDWAEGLGLGAFTPGPMAFDPIGGAGGGGFAPDQQTPHSSSMGPPPPQ